MWSIADLQSAYYQCGNEPLWYSRHDYLADWKDRRVAPWESHCIRLAAVQCHNWSLLTLLHSRTQKQYFVGHVYLRLLQYHLHPIWRFEIVHVHAESLHKSQLLSISFGFGLVWLTAPSITVGTIILADLKKQLVWYYLEEWQPELTSSPLSLSHIRTPFLPVLCTLPVLLETLLFLCQVLMMVNLNHGSVIIPSSRE